VKCTVAEHGNSLLLSYMQDIRADLREIRDDVGEVKVSVGKLESYAEGLDERLLKIEEGQSYTPVRGGRKSLMRDGGLTVSGATVALVVAAVLNHFWPPKPAPNPAPAITQAYGQK
jgi:hypothetical protein